MPATKPLAPGQKRLHTGLDVKFDFECEATLDILFSKKRVSYADLLKFDFLQLIHTLKYHETYLHISNQFLHFESPTDNW